MCTIHHTLCFPLLLPSMVQDPVISMTTRVQMNSTNENDTYLNSIYIFDVLDIFYFFKKSFCLLEQIYTLFHKLFETEIK